MSRDPNSTSSDPQSSHSLLVSADAFADIGRMLVDALESHLRSLPDKKPIPGLTGSQVRWVKQQLGQSELPEEGQDARECFAQTLDTLLRYSTHFNHPRFWGYIVSSPSPVALLADMMAQGTNQATSAWLVSPFATEIELQAVQWLGELINYPCGQSGIFTSGGNMANFMAMATARENRPYAYDKYRIYTTRETHVWIERAVKFLGYRPGALTMIDTDEKLRMIPGQLAAQIEKDLQDGLQPGIVVATCGTIRTGVVDPLGEIASICEKYRLWLHVDGAYGAFAGAVADVPGLVDPEARNLRLADSVALDPHKWLYVPIEAGCLLVRDAKALPKAFSYYPEYYELSEKFSPINLYNHGVQNTRGFRALKVWLTMKVAGSKAIKAMIQKNVLDARRLYDRAKECPELEAVSNNLSNTTFRYLSSLPEIHGHLERENALNRAIVETICQRGSFFVSNAEVHGKYVIRVCNVNAYSAQADFDAFIDEVLTLGKQLESAGLPHPTSEPDLGAKRV